MSWIAENPGAWIRLLGRKLVIFWNAYELPDNYNYYEVREVLLHPLSLPGALLFLPLHLTFGLIAPLGLTGILLTGRRWRELLLVHLTLFGYMGTVLLFFNFSRFRVPIVPFLCLFAGATLVALVREGRTWVAVFASRTEPGGTAGVWGALRDRIQRRPFLLVPPLFFAGAWLVVNLVGSGGRGVFPALQYHLSLGDTYRSQSRYPEAEKEYRLGLQILGDETMDAATGVALGVDPGRIRQEVERERLAQGVNFSTVRCGLHYGLGALWVRQGQDLLDRDRVQAEELIRRGIQEIERAVQVVPYPPHLKRLAEAYSLLSLTTEAEKTYRLALNLSENDFGLHYDLAGVLFQAGRFPEALAEMQAARKTKTRLNPSELSDYHYGMGLLRLDGYRDRGKALFHLRKALEADPDHREKKRIQEIVSDLLKAGVRAEPEE